MKAQAKGSNPERHAHRVANEFWMEAEPLLDQWNHFNTYKNRLSGRLRHFFAKALMAYIADIPDMAWMKQPRKNKDRCEGAQRIVEQLVGDIDFSAFSHFLTGLMHAYVLSIDSRTIIREQIITEITAFFLKTEMLASPARVEINRDLDWHRLRMHVLNTSSESLRKTVDDIATETMICLLKVHYQLDPYEEAGSELRQEVFPKIILEQSHVILRKLQNEMYSGSDKVALFPILMQPEFQERFEAELDELIDTRIYPIDSAMMDISYKKDADPDEMFNNFRTLVLKCLIDSLTLYHYHIEQANNSSE